MTVFNRLSLPALLLAGCAEPPAVEEDVDFAEASFVLGEPSDCEAAFEGPWLSQLAADRGWDAEDVTALCGELSDIADTYAASATLTTVTVAGVGQVDGETLQSAYYVGVAGYDLDAIRTWADAAADATAVRRCIRDARIERRATGTLPDGFVSECVETESGVPYPDPIFRETRSSMGIDEVGDTGAGLAASLAVYSVPGEGVVVAFLGGAFYAQADPAYGAFLGCGAAIGFDADAGKAAGAALCLAAEYL